MFIVGPSELGKSMLARLLTILPAMILSEVIDITRIRNVVGLTGARTTWVTPPHFEPCIARSWM
jgi:predicted ATPase with chaperone activity